MSLGESQRRPVSVTSLYDLNPEQRAKAEARYSRLRRNLALAYVYWALGGLAGTHRHYLGMRRSGIGLMAAVVFGSLTVWLDIGFAVMVFGVAVWLADGFRLPRLVRERNETLRKRSYDAVG